MAILFDKDPLTGLTQYYDYDPLKDEHQIHTVQDPTALIEQLKQIRNNPEAWNKGVKESWAHYASIPPIVEMQLKAKGIDIYNKDQTKELLKEINENYPFLKTTTKKHG
jgi:hypothetical protein